MDKHTDCKDVKTVYRLYEEKSHTLLPDKLTFIFLELNKFKKRAEDLDGNILEGMDFCLKNMTKLKECPEVLTHDVFRKMFDISELVNMDEVTRSKVLLKMTTERDLRNQMDYAKEEGRVEQNFENAKKFKELGVDIAIISQATGLDPKTIEEL
jgi:predicted transposase/invertase (TIGR01784 family)